MSASSSETTLDTVFVPSLLLAAFLNIKRRFNVWIFVRLFNVWIFVRLFNVWISVKHPENADMSGCVAMPRLGNKIFVPGKFSHKEEDDPEDEYYMLVDISDPGDGLCLTATRLVGGKHGRLSTDDDDTLQLDLDKFRVFRGYFLRDD